MSFSIKLLSIENMSNLDYDEWYKMSILQPQKVWDHFAQDVDWDEKYTQVLDNVEAQIPNWFVNGKINMSYNCLDKNVKDGYGENVAIIAESFSTERSTKITYKELLNTVELLAGVMINKCGILKGDRVLLYFPVIPQCLIGMLACTRIGAIYSVIFGGFSSDAIALRIKHIEPKLILTCNVSFDGNNEINYKEKIDKAIDKSQQLLSHCIVYKRPNSTEVSMTPGRDLDWQSEISRAYPHYSVALESNHPMLIIYTSGTTGEPKGLVIGTGNAVVIAKYVIKYLFGLKQNEIFWSLSDFGWLTGQLMMSYGLLLNGCTTVLYEGNPISRLDPDKIPRILNRHNIPFFFSSPTILRHFKNYCSEIEWKIIYKDLRGIFVGGELSDDHFRNWILEKFECPVYNIYGQTEFFGVGLSPCLGFHRNNYKLSIPTMGMNFKVVNTETGEILPNETPGRVLLKTPINPSLSLTFYKNNSGFIKTYFTKYPGFYDTMDQGVLKNDGSLQILSRMDDVIRISAHRLSGGAFEEICLKNENIVNAAVVSLSDSLNGQLPVAFVVTASNTKSSENEIKQNIIELVERYIGKFALFQRVFIVPNLPETKTGKISRNSLSSMINGTEYRVPSTVENPLVYKEIYDILLKAGYNASLPIDYHNYN